MGCGIQNYEVTLVKITMRVLCLVLTVLLLINWKLALVTCFPIPLILVSGIIFARALQNMTAKS